VIRSLALTLLMLAGPALAADTPTPTAEDLLNAADDVARGEHAIAKVRMTVKTARYERSLTMQSWSLGTDLTLIRILEPAKEEGMSTLKVSDNIWNYLPKIDRTMKVPAGMMGGSWMGSHFSNDDLVKESRLADDFTYQITGTPETGEHWVLELVPKPDTAVVWGKVITKVSADMLPVEITYYDEHDVLARTMRFEDIKELGGRRMPSRFLLIPADKPDEMTLVEYLEMDFETEVPEKSFSLAALKK
jgi:hypothetical protein